VLLVISLIVNFFDSRARNGQLALCVGRKAPKRWRAVQTENHMLTKNSNMPFLSLHALAAVRGDGLRPEFIDLFKRLVAGATLSETAEPPTGFVVESKRRAAP
jgi:hypothetical protein